MMDSVRKSFAAAGSMPRPEQVTSFLASLSAVLMLLAPAVWNGFPLLQWDTGGYLARWYEGTLAESRSTVYGLFLYLLQSPDFWPVVFAQAALTTWVVALVLRAYRLTHPAHLFMAMATLALLTALPWLAGMLLTDIFAGLAVVAVHMLTFESNEISNGERLALVLVVAAAAASHSASFAVLLALLGGASVISFWAPEVVAMERLAPSAAGIVLGALVLLAGNFALTGRVAWTPGGAGIIFARMVEDGLAKRYLDRHCPNPRLRLCAYRDDLPATADDFLWGSGSVFDRLGRFDGLNDEMRTIVVGSLAADPGRHLTAAAAATARQLVTVGTGEGVVPWTAHTRGIIRRYTPAAVTAMRAARQQRGQLDVFPQWNTIHVPVALGGALAMLAMVGTAVRRRAFSRLDRFAAVVVVALVANAAVCAIISNPHPRYGARLAWLAPLVLVVAAMRRTVPSVVRRSF